MVLNLSFSVRRPILAGLVHARVGLFFLLSPLPHLRVRAHEMLLTSQLQDTPVWRETLPPDLRFSILIFRFSYFEIAAACGFIISTVDCQPLAVSSQCLLIFREISRWLKAQLQPYPDISWRLWCLVFAWRIVLWRCPSSCVAGRKRYRREVRSQPRLAGVGYCPRIARRRRSGCRCRRSDARFLRQPPLRRPLLALLPGCPF